MNSQKYQILIVDDEAIIRNGLGSIINWNELGFSDPYLAGNGAEALEILRTTPIDTLMTDIRMPEINGLELICFAKEINPNIKVVIISGYDKFEYAFEGIKLQVEDYILKPINPEQVEKTFFQIKEKLDMGKKRDYAYFPQLFEDFNRYKEQIIAEIEGNDEDLSYRAFLSFQSSLKTIPLPSAVTYSNEILKAIGTHFNLSIEKINDLLEQLNSDSIKNSEDLEKALAVGFSLCLENICTQTDKMAKVICIRAKRIVDEQFRNPNLSIRNISKNLSVSFGYLSAVYSKIFGMSLKTYLIEVRMRHARSLLLSRNYRIKDVAKAVGYNNPRYFSDAFTNFYGKSPSEFLQQINENSAQSILDIEQ